MAERRRSEPLTIFHCNWRAFEVFLYSASQWRYKPDGNIQSLDYPSVSSVMDMLNIKPKKRPDVFMRVRQIEAAVIDELNKETLGK